MFFVSSHVFSYDLSYLKNVIPPGSFDASIYETIEDIIENGISEKQNNKTTFLFNDTEVIILENTMSKTRYGDPDTTIIFIDKTRRIRIAITYNQKHDYYNFSIRGL